MICAYISPEVKKNDTTAMTTVQMKLVQGDDMKIAI